MMEKWSYNLVKEKHQWHLLKYIKEDFIQDHRSAAVQYCLTWKTD
jgi:hypothetical protein